MGLTRIPFQKLKACLVSTFASFGLWSSSLVRYSTRFGGYLVWPTESYSVHVGPTVGSRALIVDGGWSVVLLKNENPV